MVNDGSFDYVLGGDLGKTNDPTTFVLLSRHVIPKEIEAYEYRIRRIEELPLGTTYPNVRRRLRDICLHPTLFGRVSVALDNTGVGRAVLDEIREDKDLRDLVYGITNTAGKNSKQDFMDWTVPKRELVGVTVLAMQKVRLKVSNALPNLSQLRKQLLEFKVEKSKVSGAILFEGKQNTHDDLVLALCGAVWLGGQIPMLHGGCLSSSFAPYRIDGGNPATGRSTAAGPMPSWREGLNDVGRTAGY